MSKLKKISLKELKNIRNLGQGTFGLVKLVQFETKHFALKCLQKKQIVRYNLVDNILYEKRMMEESDHPFVLKLINTFQDQDRLYMMLEVVPGGELFAFLQKRGGYVPTKHARFIFLHVSYLCLSTHTLERYLLSGPETGKFND